MVYEVFVRKKNGSVINEIYKSRSKALARFTELSKRFPEVDLTKRRKSWRSGGDRKD